MSESGPSIRTASVTPKQPSHDTCSEELEHEPHRLSNRVGRTEALEVEAVEDRVGYGIDRKGTHSDPT